MLLIPTSFVKKNAQTIKVVLSLLIIVLALLGIFDAGYITYEEFSGAIPVCGEGFDCGKVLTSKWAYIGPVPLSVFGLVYYITMLSLGVLHYLEVDISHLTKGAKGWKLPKWMTQRISGLTVQEMLLFFSALGFIFSLYLVILMGLIIKGWCLYCLLSALTSTLLFVVNLKLYWVAWIDKQHRLG